MRIFMGHWRTICNCDLCAINCRFIPGYLLPEDLDYIATFLGYSEVFKLAEKNLLASPGAIVIKDGRLCRIHTLVPARNDSGCVSFTRLLLLAARSLIHTKSSLKAMLFHPRVYR